MDYFDVEVNALLSAMHTSLLLQLLHRNFLQIYKTIFYVVLLSILCLQNSLCPL